MTNPLETTDRPLDEKLGHLLSRLSLAMRADSWDATAALGLNPTQGQILLLLYRRNAGLRLSEIAEELSVSSPTVSDSVTTLVEKEYVTKKRAVDDGRAIAVTLTAKGRKRVSKIEEKGDVVQVAIGALGSEEQLQLYRMLIRILRELQVQERISTGRMCVTCRYFEPNRHQNASRPHHCSLVGAAFGDKTIRSDCPEHEVASDETAEANWRRFSQT